MLEKLERCPVCSGQEQELFLRCADHSISKESFNLMKCKSCGFVFTNPRPAEHSIGEYYKSEEYVSHSDSKKGLINKLYHAVRKFTLGKKLNLINGISNKGNLLDVGCGTGYFLDICKRHGWQTSGTEPDPEARKLAEDLSKSSIAENLFEVRSQNFFNVITLWHVLEHIHQLNESVEHLKKLLKPGGKLIIAVPNLESYDAKVFKDFWAAYDVPRHLYHFSETVLKKLMQKHDLKHKETIGMPFDSLYVSMMSEKYLSKNKSLSFPLLFKSFLIGSLSNIYAIKGVNYSSKIYIFEK